jgi:hypothetical protein
MLVGVIAFPVMADPMPGAIWTTDSSGDTVNQNIYLAKSYVYLNGGPKNGGGGLPEGDYFVQVTTPDGDILGKTNTASVHVDANGNFAQVIQLSYLAAICNPRLLINMTGKNKSDLKS